MGGEEGRGRVERMRGHPKAMPEVPQLQIAFFRKVRITNGKSKN